MKASKLIKLSFTLALLFTASISASAYQNNDFVYNSKEVNGLKVGQIVYKSDGNTLSNYMNYNYRYDDQKRLIESEASKWDSSRNEWVKSECIRYDYQAGNVTTTYYKWNSRKGAYELEPERTVTVVYTAR